MKQIGLALGGGCLRGAAHVGVLKELTRRGVEVTHLAGTSSGAIMAGLYACGATPWQMEETLRDLSIRKMMDLKIGRQGLSGQRIYEKLLKLTDGRHFSDLKVPLSVVCVDLISGNLEVIRSGEVALALRASMSLPGILAPVERGNQLLVDGYVLNNNPANIVKAMGAAYVIAVKVSHLPERPSCHVLSHLSRYLSIASQQATEQQVQQHADLVIDIELNHIGRLDFRAVSEAIVLGEQETRRVMNGCVPVEAVNMYEGEHDQAQLPPLMLGHVK